MFTFFMIFPDDPQWLKDVKFGYISYVNPNDTRWGNTLSSSFVNWSENE